MKACLGHGVLVRAMLVAGALLVLASVLGGCEKLPEAQAAPPAGKQALRQASEEALPGLNIPMADLERQRVKRERQDLFASRSWTPPAAPPVPVAPTPKAVPPPAPSAPPLPFKFLGRRADAEKLVVYLLNGETTYNAVVGDTLDNAYRIESISESAVQFVYLPLGITQSLNIARPQ